MLLLLIPITKQYKRVNIVPRSRSMALNHDLISDTKILMGFIIRQAKTMHNFCKWGAGTWSCSKISYEKPHQVTYHFKGLEKLWWLVKIRNFILIQNKWYLLEKFDTFYYAKVWNTFMSCKPTNLGKQKLLLILTRVKNTLFGGFQSCTWSLKRGVDQNFPL